MDAVVMFIVGPLPNFIFARVVELAHTNGYDLAIVRTKDCGLLAKSFFFENSSEHLVLLNGKVFIEMSGFNPCKKRNNR